MATRYRRRGGARKFKGDDPSSPSGDVCNFKNPDKLKARAGQYPPVLRRAAAAARGAAEVPNRARGARSRMGKLRPKEQAVIDFLQEYVGKDGTDLDKLVIDWIDRDDFGETFSERTKGLVDGLDGVALVTLGKLMTDDKAPERVRLRACEVVMRMSGRLEDKTTVNHNHTHGVAEHLLKNAAPMQLEAHPEQDEGVIDIAVLRSSGQ